MSCEIIRFPTIIQSGNDKQSDRIKLAADSIMKSRKKQVDSYFAGRTRSIDAMQNNVIQFPKIIKHQNTAISDKDVELLKRVFENRKKILQDAIDKLMTMKPRKE